MLEGFFYGQKKLPIISFSYIIPIRKDNFIMAMSRKHYWKFVELIKDYTVMKKSVDSNFEYQSLTNLFKQVLKEDNRNFDSIRFQDAVDTKIKKLLI